MEVPARLGSRRGEVDEDEVTGEGVRLLDGGGDGMEGVLSIDDDVLLSLSVMDGEGGALSDNCSS